MSNPDLPLLWTVGALAAGVVIGAMIVIVLVLHRRWVRPVRELAQSAQQLAAGSWDLRAQVDGADDVQRLGTQINLIADEAERRFEALRNQSANLKLLVDALPDPILLSDGRDRIVLINAPAERLLQLPPQQVIGKPFVTAVNDASIIQLFETAKRLRQTGSGVRSIDREIKLTRKGLRLVFQAHAEATQTGGLLIVLRDVSTLAATLQMKTDFVANASHELRTPISAIKVAFETLREVYRDEDEALSARCITIISGHLRRLEEMLRDLLDLSRVESADLKPHLAPVRLADLLAVVRSMWEPIAREKQVELALPTSDQAMQFVSDRRLLDLVLKNLVENAIKFTPAGGRVTVGVKRVQESSGEAVQICVADTGCGIPPEHLERVFERFYQVDNARSGAAGRGTGLGLAIVKHAVSALGGTVSLTSELGRGTRALCTLPQREASVDTP